MGMRLVAAAIFLCAASAAAQTPQESATHLLHALFDEAWERHLRQEPLYASSRGDRRYDRLWPDVSAAALERRHQEDVATLARLDDIDRELLTAAEKLNYDLFAHRYRNRITGHTLKAYLFELRPAKGAHTLTSVAEMLPFATVADYDNWIARLRSIDVYLKQQADLLALGIREKRVQPKAVAERAESALTALLAVGDATESAFYAPFKRIPPAIAADERARLQAEGKETIETVVLPAYRRFEKFFRERYVPASRTTAGLWDTPGGDALYAQRVAHFTTTSLTPNEIHEIGLSEVARIRAQMEELMRQTGFRGSFAEFLVFLRTDPQFYFQSPDELLRAYTVTEISVSTRIPTPSSAS